MLVYWLLVIAFANDASWVLKEHRAANLALKVIRQDHTRKGGIKERRLQAGWDTAYHYQLFTLVPELPG